MSYVGRQLYEYKPAADPARTVASIAGARDRFERTLGKELQARTVLPPHDPEWRQWSNLPPRPDYAGALMKDLSPHQISAFLDLVVESTSESGFAKIRDIILSDDKLVTPGGRSNSSFLMGSDYYFIVLFGKPSDDGIWGWQLDGHHLGLNVVIQEGNLTIAPSFIGTQPADFTYGQRRHIQPMKVEATLPYEIIGSLSDSQRSKAVTGPRTQSLEAGPGQDSVIPSSTGLAISELGADQKSMLEQLCHAWIGIMPEAWASKEMKAVRAALDQGQFIWKGETAPGSPVYYQIRTPNFLVEFTHQNLGGDPMNHLHSVYRKPGQDYLGASIGQ